MRWSISKSINLGPLKITFSKTGLTASLGIPGARVSLNTKGQAGIRLGKKGFSYTKQKKVFKSVKEHFKKE